MAGFLVMVETARWRAIQKKLHAEDGRQKATVEPESTLTLTMLFGRTDWTPHRLCALTYTHKVWTLTSWRVQPKFHLLSISEIYIREYSKSWKRILRIAWFIYIVLYFISFVKFVKQTVLVTLCRFAFTLQIWGCSYNLTGY